MPCLPRAAGSLPAVERGHGGGAAIPNPRGQLPQPDGDETPVWTMWRDARAHGLVVPQVSRAEHVRAVPSRGAGTAGLVPGMCTWWTFAPYAAVVLLEPNVPHRVWT